MEHKLDKIDVKLDKLDSRLNSVEIILARNTASLELHMRRTDALEELVKEDMGPVKKHVAVVTLGIRGVMFASGALTGIAGFVYLLKQLNII